MVGDEAALIANAVAGRSHAQIAQAAGVSVSSVQRRLKDADIQQKIREEQSRLRRARLADLNDVGTAAMQRLRALIDCDEPAIALRAVALSLTSAIRLDEIVDLGARLAAVEELVESRADDDEAH